MVELARSFCEICEIEGMHLIKTYYDGTVMHVCINCRHIEMIKLGYDYIRIKKALANEKLAVDLFPQNKPAQ